MGPHFIDFWNVRIKNIDRLYTETPVSTSEAQKRPPSVDVHDMHNCVWRRCSSGHFEAVTHGTALQWAAICISFHVRDIRLMACDWCDEY